MLKLKNVSYIREDLTILNHVNWEVKQGEHWAILGLNGSGKTTLLNIINGYEWPTSGQVTVLDKLFGTYDLRELRKRIGWVSSSLQSKMYESDSAYSIVLSGKYNTIGVYDEIVDEDKQQAEVLLSLFRLTHIQHKPYRFLSQGERQKVLIARALMSKPSLLILDEPCTGLDFLARESLLKTIEDLTKKLKITIIFVTHHVEEIRPFISHAMLLKNGEVFTQGEVQHILKSDVLTEFFNHKVKMYKENGYFWLTTI